MWPDYNLEDEATWIPMESPTVDSSWEAALTRIGGLNPFKQPVLVWRWGGTYRDPMAEHGGLKYWLCNRPSELQGFAFTDPVTELNMWVEHLDEVPPGIVVVVPKHKEIQLGQRRIVIEQWRSPEFLAHSGRYQENMLRDSGSVQQFFFCKACDSPLLVGNDGPNPCPKCESKRSYMREVREEGEGKLLRSFPSEGCYDCFLILENAEGGPMEPDGNTLAWIEKLWHEQKEKSLREQMSDTLVEMAPQHELMVAWRVDCQHDPRIQNNSGPSQGLAG